MRPATLLAAVALAAGLLACAGDLPAGPDATPISQFVQLDGSAAEGGASAALECRPASTPAACHDGSCRVTAGCFMMGSPPTEYCRDDDEVRHPVRLRRDFFIADHEVTRGEFQSLMGYLPAGDSSCGPSCPAGSPSWHEAAAYANVLSRTSGLEPCYSCLGGGRAVHCSAAADFEGQAIYSCRGYRLPTEAEWEYAYRAGSDSDLYDGPASTCFGEDERADRIGWYRENAAGAPRPVRTREPNAWGLYDMAGNLGEWVQDSYTALGESAAVDPCPSGGEERSYRGGAFSLHVKELRAAHRGRAAPDQSDPTIGFRLARTAPLP